MTVFDILESIFKDYEGQGKLVPAWRLDINDQSLYQKRSLSTQYQERDLAFTSMHNSDKE
jgi:type VI secretion system secreted protein VgrG